MRKWIVGGLLALSMGVMSTSAEAAAIRILISSTTCSVACAPVEVIGVGNVAVFAGTFGDVALDITSAASDNPGDEASYLQQSSITANSTSGDAENLVIVVSQTDFTAPTGAAALGSATSITGQSQVGDITATFASVYSSGNEYYNANVDAGDVGTAALVCSGTGVVPPLSCEDSNSTLLTATAPFSLTSVFFLGLPGGASGTFGGTTTLTAVPEPASVALFGLGALGLGILRRKR